MALAAVFWAESNAFSITLVCSGHTDEIEPFRRLRCCPTYFLNPNGSQIGARHKIFYTGTVLGILRRQRHQGMATLGLGSC